MKILIIDGCPRKGNTWKLTLRAMEKIRQLCPDTEFEEITLSKLNLPFCTGCSNCFRLGPEKCPHYSIVGEIVYKIEQADGIIICSTCVDCRETTLLKNLFDHWCYMMHRPYFYKSKALIITSAGGKGQVKTAQSIETSLLAVGFNRCYQAAFAAISWNAYEPDEKAKKKDRKNYDILFTGCSIGHSSQSEIFSHFGLQYYARHGATLCGRLQVSDC